VDAHIIAAQDRQKRNYGKEQESSTKFKTGDLVYLSRRAIGKGQSKKLRNPWDGPYRIVAVKGEANYRIRHHRGGRQQLVHRDKLHPCYRQNTIDSDETEDLGNAHLAEGTGQTTEKTSASTPNAPAPLSHTGNAESTVIIEEVDLPAETEIGKADQLYENPSTLDTAQEQQRKEREHHEPSRRTIRPPARLRQISRTRLDRVEGK
jgi:hypothetical protein